MNRIFSVSSEYFFAGIFGNARPAGTLPLDGVTLANISITNPEDIMQCTAKEPPNLLFTATVGSMPIRGVFYTSKQMLEIWS